MEISIILLGWTFGFHERWRICWTLERLPVSQGLRCTKSHNELCDRFCVRIITYSLITLSRFYSRAKQWYILYQRRKDSPHSFIIWVDQPTQRTASNIGWVTRILGHIGRILQITWFKNKKREANSCVAISAFGFVLEWHVSMSSF